MKLSVLFLPFVVGGVLVLCNAPAKQVYSLRTIKPDTGIHVPYDHFTFMRSYPAKNFDVQAYRLALTQANDFQLRKSRSSTVWEVAGPLNINGRVNALAINPVNTNEMYAGTAFGGVFKTTNGGTSWNPLFDGETHLPIGAISLDPSNANTVWVGTGDNNISGSCYTGGGIYLSTDAGATWVNKGLVNTEVISKISIDPTNSNVVYAAAMGSPFTPSINRGLYKSTNGGTTWSNVLFVNDSTGIIDLVMDPNAPGTLYAASYTRMRTSERSTYHSDQCKIYKTTNGGTTWTTLSGGLPTGDIGRIGLAISATHSNVLYAIVASTSSSIQGIYKTTDAGVTWVAKNSSPLESIGTCYSSYGWYFGKIHVNPADDNMVYVYGVDKFMSTDGGDNWTLFAPDWSTYEVHADGHDLAFIDNQKIVLATDGGLYKTTNNGVSWTDIDNMPTTQFYRVTHMPLSAETFYGGAQDNGTIGGTRYNSPTWAWVFGGDGFKFYANPTDTNIQYYATQYGGIYYSDWGSIGALNSGFTGSERFNWDTPYMLDRFDPNIVYLGAESMYKMTGAPYGFFTAISTDLTNGPVLPLYDGNTISCIDQNYFNQNTLYAATSDAHAWVTTNGGATWTSIASGLPNRYATSINASPNTSSNVYISFSGYRIDDDSPHLYKSTNNGTTWTSIQGDLPNFAVNDVLVKPGDENTIFIGTDAGVYVTLNGGVNWEPLGTGMPLVAVLELELNQTNTVLAAATFGRGIQVIDLESPVGINEEQNSPLSVYPNPASNWIHVTNATAAREYCIYDINGKQQKTGKLKEGNNSIDIRQLRIGTYVLVNGNAKRKFIVR